MNAAIDLGLEHPAVIIEAKILGTAWKWKVREAVAQLYEYRYFQVIDPAASLLILADKPLPVDWVRYLESDRKIGLVWPAGRGWHLSARARKVFPVG